MDVFKAIKKRTSVRSYSDEDISKKDWNKLLKVARMAPSAKNLQPWKLIVVRDKKVKKKLVSACHNQAFVKDADAVIIGLIENEKWADIDLAIALDHLSLQAVELNLGTCWIGSFNEKELRELLDVPDKYEIKACMTVGYPSDNTNSPVKKSVDELVHWEKF